jgi:hypothetical protein
MCVHTFLMARIRPWISLGAVQLTPTAATLLQESATAAQWVMGSPLAALAPSLEVKENQAGIRMSFSSRSSQ